MQWDSLWINGLIATCEQGYGLIENAAIAAKDGKIAWLGAMQDLPGAPEDLAFEVFDLEQRCLTPGLIDCHTHLVYAGNRANEFQMRLTGKSYEDIAREGGGIQSTVKSTRSASEDELLKLSMPRLHSLIASGVTTVEIKSGYGLDLETELKILRVAQYLEDIFPITIKRTFLGAHTIPPEYREKADDYVDLICNNMIPVIAENKLAEAVDVFCEKIAFTLQQTEEIFKAAKHHGLTIKCHSEQLTDSNSAALAAKYQALSVDHLEHLSENGIEAIAHSGTVAVLLPGAFYFLKEKKMPPINSLRKNNVPIAIATDCNPGTSPCASILIIMNMACTQFGLTPEEALVGVTHNAAKALGMNKTHGTLTIGKVADFSIWNIKHPDELSYYLGMILLDRIVKEGESYAI